MIKCWLSGIIFERREESHCMQTFQDGGRYVLIRYVCTVPSYRTPVIVDEAVQNQKSFLNALLDLRYCTLEHQPSDRLEKHLALLQGHYAHDYSTS